MIRRLIDKIFISKPTVGMQCINILTTCGEEYEHTHSPQCRLLWNPSIVSNQPVRFLG